MHVSPSASVISITSLELHKIILDQQNPGPSLFCQLNTCKEKGWSFQYVAKKQVIIKYSSIISSTSSFSWGFFSLLKFLTIENYSLNIKPASISEQRPYLTKTKSLLQYNFWGITAILDSFNASFSSSKISLPSETL